MMMGHAEMLMLLSLSLEQQQPRPSLEWLVGGYKETVAPQSGVVVDGGREDLIGTNSRTPIELLNNQKRLMFVSSWIFSFGWLAE